MECERETADIACSRVRIEDVVQLFRLVARRLNNLPATEVESNSVEARALINRRGVETDVSLDRVFHGSGKNLAIGNIAVATANNRRNSLDAEAQIGSQSFYLYS